MKRPRQPRSETIKHASDETLLIAWLEGFDRVRLYRERALHLPQSYASRQNNIGQYRNSVRTYIVLTDEIYRRMTPHERRQP